MSNPADISLLYLQMTKSNTKKLGADFIKIYLSD